ncbi:TPA: hypothetical protein JIU99_02475 [Acinetobacter baumannii]|nr:hypothetical protein [Acinetobacter baumannii]HAV4921356.1 hypothetical protein [Acinetobacter baumannii]HAV4931508.1 hypothetical protein [Acinetobacter baumannii]
MTVPVSDRLSQLYVGNGTNTRFDFTFRIFQQEDATGLAVRKKGSTDFETVDPATYTVTINPDEMGGYITFNFAPDVQSYFYIAGATPLDQLLDITNYDNFYPDAIERALDKLTALLQEWGTELDLEKQARILADIQYDSLAMEREENLEGRLISYINAVVGITNPKIFDGISDRMVITEDGRTQRDFNKSIPFWTNDYVNFKQATYIREEQILDHGNAQNAALKIELNESIDIEKQRAISAETEINNKLNANNGGRYGFNTYAEFDAVKATLQLNSLVNIAEVNSTGSGEWGQGDNIWNGVVLKKSPYDPLQQAIIQAKIIAQLEALLATMGLLNLDTGNLLDFLDVNMSQVGYLSKKGEFYAQDFKTDFGGLNSLAETIWSFDIPGTALALIDKGLNVLWQLKNDGSVVNSITPASYGVAELRNGLVNSVTANDIGYAYDKALTQNDTPLKMIATVSPWGADGTRNQRMGSAIKVGPNKLYVAFSQFSTHSTDQADGRLVGRFVDYDLVNQTYTVSDTLVIVGNMFGNVYRHPHFIQLRDRILLIFNGAMDELLVYESLDKCQTWQPKTSINCAPPLPWATALDSAVLIEEGRYKGRIVLSLFRYSATDGLVGTVYSDDGGTTWKRGQTLHGAELFPAYPSINETTVGLDAQNNLIFIIRNEESTADSRYLIFGKSTDGGETIQIFQQNQKTTALACQTGIKQTAPTSFDGLPRMIVTCPTTELNKGDRESFRLRISYDNCKSWSKTYKPFVDTLRVGYTSVIPLGGDGKNFAMVYEEGTLNSSQSLKILFFNLKEVI